MEDYYSVRAVSLMTGWCKDTARERMAKMPGVINVGSQHRRQLMVPQSGLMNWLANHRMEIPQVPEIRKKHGGGIARRDRRTGELVDKKKGR